MKTMATQKEQEQWRKASESMADYMESTAKISCARMMEILRESDLQVYHGGETSYFSLNICLGLAYACGYSNWKDGPEDWTALTKTGKQREKFARLSFSY